MQNDADHNVGRMKLDHAPTQVAPPRFLVTRAAVLRHDTADASISDHVADLWPLSLPRSVRTTDVWLDLARSIWINQAPKCIIQRVKLDLSVESTKYGWIYISTQSE